MTARDSSAPRRQQRWIAAKNVGSTQIPSYGACEVTAVTNPINGVLQYSVQKPSSNAVKEVCFNSRKPIDASGFGVVTFDYPAECTANATPTVGDTLGVASGDYDLDAGQTGFVCVGVLGSVVRVIPASAVTGVLEDLDTLGAPTADGEFLVATGAGAFAYETGNTARTSLGLGTGDSPTFTGLTISGSSFTINGQTASTTVWRSKAYTFADFTAAAIEQNLDTGLDLAAGETLEQVIVDLTGQLGDTGPDTGSWAIDLGLASAGTEIGSQLDVSIFNNTTSVAKHNTVNSPIWSSSMTGSLGPLTSGSASSIWLRFFDAAATQNVSETDEGGFTLYFQITEAP